MLLSHPNNIDQQSITIEFTNARTGRRNLAATPLYNNVADLHKVPYAEDLPIVSQSSAWSP
jgi:hypothetical protein